MALKMICVVFLIMLVAVAGFSLAKNMDLDHGVSMARKYETGFLYKGQMFNFFPKGIPIPPSAPSKTHNSLPTD
ncbi:hypothetical protein GQ457_02G018090 [Hibiscus cannabinus]